jgi:hypothetical protein
VGQFDWGGGYSLVSPLSRDHICGMKLNCPKCAVVVTIDDEGPFIFNNALCAELAGTEYQFKPEWCPVLSDAAPDDVYLLPAGYRGLVEAAIEKANKGR